MATIKIKFRPSSVSGREGCIIYQVIHKRTTRQQKTSYRLYSHEWNKNLSQVILPKSSQRRHLYLSDINDKIQMDVKRLQRIICRLQSSHSQYTAKDVLVEFTTHPNEDTLFTFMQGIIHQLKAVGKIRTSETYVSTLNSFKQFRKNKDLALEDIDSDMMMSYESYLRNRGITPNSSSFYMRILRAVYNRSVEKELSVQRFPFKHVYTGVDKTIKRALPLKTMKKIKEMDLSRHPSLDFARDMFLFSFYTRGMSFIDMAYLRKTDLKNGILSYRRQKTRQCLFIKWEKNMQEIVSKYNTSHSPYLLPIIQPQSQVEIRKQYIYKAHSINRSLKIIGQQLGLAFSLTMYVSRHSWASIAKSKKVPITIISEGMGHNSEKTTRIYLASLDTLAIDKANSLILRSM